jgi:uncharacterized protein (DUF2147 family)
MQACAFRGLIYGQQIRFHHRDCDSIARSAIGARAKRRKCYRYLADPRGRRPRVRVSKCGSGICGVIVGLKDPIDPATGKPQVDDKNPNPALKRRPMISLPLFSGMHPTSPGKWSGQIYNADDGSPYAGKVSVTGRDTLRVEGCVGALCGGETWTRVKR